MAYLRMNSVISLLLISFSSELYPEIVLEQFSIRDSATLFIRSVDNTLIVEHTVGDENFVRVARIFIK